MYLRIMFTCSDTCCTLSRPLFLPVLDLPPRSYHDSMPGSTALNPFALSRCMCGSDSSDRLDSAIKSIESGGAASSIASMTSSNLTPKLGSCQATIGRLYLVSRNRRSSFITSTSSARYGTVESMQKLHVYGQPRLPSIGTTLINGAFLTVGSINFQRSRTPGSWAGCCLAAM